MLALADVGEVAMQFYSGEDREDGVDDESDDTDGIGDHSPRVALDMVDLGSPNRNTLRYVRKKTSLT